jgi:hypothetical protein
MTVRPTEPFDLTRPVPSESLPLRGICLIVKDNEARHDHGPRPLEAGAAAKFQAAKFPRRPDPRVLSESIPLFFIGRNQNRLWVAREAEGRAGGIFLFKRGALRFAGKHSEGKGCATMFLDHPFELDVANQGSPLIERLDALMRAARRHPNERTNGNGNQQ